MKCSHLECFQVVFAVLSVLFLAFVHRSWLFVVVLAFHSAKMHLETHQYNKQALVH